MTSYDDSNPCQNRILASLPSAEYERLLPRLKEVNLIRGDILYNPGDQIDYVYFPNSGIVSLVTLLSEGESVEVGVVGSEGMIGIPIVLGDDRAPVQAVVQIDGKLMKLAADVLAEELKHDGELRILLQRFIAFSMQQTAQTAACTRNHRIVQRLAFWLLTCQDRIGGNRLKLTQDFIAEMLGTRRAGVSEAAMTLQSMNLIQYARGDIRVLDRPGLEEFSCECYRVVRNEFDRLLNTGSAMSAS